MKLKLIKFFSNFIVTGIFVATTAHASMLGLCYETHTQYICCPSSGGWIVSYACNPGAASYCVNDSGLIAGTQTTILQDCKNRGGSGVSYYLNREEIQQNFDQSINNSQNTIDNNELIKNNFN